MRFLRWLLLPGFLLILCGCRPKTEPGPILVGHMAPFSGPDKRIGEQARQAIMLAIEKANKEENSVVDRRVGVLHTDPHDDLNALQPQTVRLITVNHVVALLGGANAAQVERLGPAAQPYDVAVLTPVAVPPEFMAENVFSVQASLAFQGQVLARFAAKELNAGQAAVLVDARRPASLALAEAFNKEFSKGSGQAPQQWVYKGEAELAKTIQESKTGKPQVILYAGAAADLTRTQTNLEAAELAIPMLLGADDDYLAALGSKPKPSNAIYLATPYGGEEGTPALQEFVKKYQDRFQELPGNDARLAYDGVRILIQAIRRAKLASSSEVATKVRAALAGSEDFECLTGRLSFNKDHSARRPLFVIRFENGEMHEAKRFDPEGP